jgi:hypothetical protein
MRLRSAFAVSIVLLGIAFAGSSLAFAQSTTAPHKRILGYKDAATGVFHPAASSTHAAPDATVAPTTGTFEVTFNIKIVSSFPKGSVIGCETSVQFDAEETLSVSPYVLTLAQYSEGASTSVDVSGSTATCTVTIPYSWIIPSLTSASIVTLSGGYDVTVVPQSSSTTAAVFDSRESSSSIFDLTKVPATGTTSKYTVNVTL